MRETISQKGEDGDSKINRRNFLRSLGVLSAGIGMSMAVPNSLFAQENKEDAEQEEWDDIKESVEKLKTKFQLKPSKFAIIVNPEKQKLYLIKGDNIIKTYIISTSINGIGSGEGSHKTPSGTHLIEEKFGIDKETGIRSKIGAIFDCSVDTKRVAEIITEKIDIPEDKITSRIMWLNGLEEGINKGEGIDSFERHIYIHGTPEEGLLGMPASGGCIRMKNTDVIELFDLVPRYTLVEIQDKEFIAQ